MIKIINECNNFLKDCGITYAVCGGYAIELFMNKKLRSHGDIDTIVFEEDKIRIVDYVLNKGWNIYEHKSEWDFVNNKKGNSYLRQVLSLNDESIIKPSTVWAIKPDSSLVKIKPKSGNDNIFDYEILNKEQLNFDFFEIIFNKRENSKFIVDSFSSQKKNITREIQKAVLYNNGIPYLAPEIILLIISHPEYLKSNYHREKNIIDFNSTIPFLSQESKDWLINALETAYPEGLERLEQLKTQVE